MARNNMKINFPTNVVNPITYATYMQIIDSQPGGQVDAAYAGNTLFPTMKNGKDGAGKKDTHTIGVLIDYGLAQYVDDKKKIVALTHFGKRFLEVFKKCADDDSGRMERKENVDINYNALMLEILLNWKEAVGDKIFYPGALIIRLLMDERMEYKFNAYEWEFICENIEFIETSNYDKLVSDVIAFRKSGQVIDLKKAHDFCNSLANSWALLYKNDEKFYLLRELTKENIKVWQANNRDLIYTIAASSTQGEGATSSTVVAELTPEWFRAHASEFDDILVEAEIQYDDFQEKFAPEVLSTLSGEELLRKMFYSGDSNKENLCYYLEFHIKNRELFGSVAGGSAYKFNLFYQKKKASWVTGSSAKPKLLTLDEAIVLGTEIRDALVKGAEIIKANQDINDAEGYNNLYNQLFAAMGRYINLLWVQKYYHLIFPDMFPVFYNEAWQKHVLNKLDIEPYDSGFVRMGQISLFANECDVENVVFAQIIYKYCNMIEDEGEPSGDDVVDNDTPEAELPTLLPRDKNKIMPLNFILYGAPGTGKTYATAEYAMAIIEGRKVDLSQKTPEERSALMEKYKAAIKEGRITFTTFHQSYGYEDFIQGLRPDTKQGGLNFVPVDGVFKRIVNEAIRNGDKDYVIIIDEINRANISKVFGELITLIESDKRWGEINALSVTLPSGEPFAVPNNLFIVGTMNSADKSISLIDAALRRRFDFIEVVPNSAIIENEVLRTILDRLNDYLFKELDSTDLLVGHAYFMGKTEDDLCDIINHSIVPLLYEYFYDNSNKVKNILEKAIEGYNYQVTPAKVGRLKLTVKG